MILNHMVNKDTGHELKCENGQIEACTERGYVMKVELDESRASSDASPVDSTSLKDLVDDRALKGLAEINVFTIADFKAADPKALDLVKYVTKKTIAKVINHGSTDVHSSS